MSNGASGQQLPLFEAQGRQGQRQIVCAGCGLLCRPTAHYCPGCGLSLAVSLMPSPSGPIPMGLTPQALLGSRYRLVSSIGNGAMGVIWHAFDEQLNRPCVIKGVLVQGLTSAEQAERRVWLAREASMLASINHPAICTILDIVTEGQDRYLVLEYIDGHTLEEELRARGTPGLPEADVVRWGVSLCEALSYIHNQTPPIIFRDLKPSNVMLRPDGHVVLIDFGIARLGGTTAGTAIGTPGYAPLEQYHGHVNAQSDVYALGATLHHLLTGVPPEKHPTPFTFPPVRSLVPDIGPHIDAAVEQALQHDPNDRFQSAVQLMRALKTVSGVAPVRSQSVTPSASSQTTASSSARRSRAALPGLERLDALIAEACQRGTPPPDILLVGPLPAGLAIHDLMQAIAGQLSVYTHPRAIQGHTMSSKTKRGKADGFRTGLFTLQPRDLLCIENVQALDAAHREYLHNFMTYRVLEVTFWSDNQRKSHAVPIDGVTIVASMPRTSAWRNEVASYFAEQIDVRVIPPEWERRMLAARPESLVTVPEIGETDTPIREELIGFAGEVARNHAEHYYSRVSRWDPNWQWLEISEHLKDRIIECLVARGTLVPDAQHDARYPESSWTYQAQLHHVNTHGSSTSTPLLSTTLGQAGSGVPSASITATTSPTAPFSGSSRIVRVSAYQLTFPHQCACCLGPVETAYVAQHTRVKGKRVKTRVNNSWSVPYCRACLAHATAHQSARHIWSAGLAFSGLVILLGILLGAATDGASLLLGLIVGAGIMAVTWWIRQARLATARSSMQPSCCTAVPAVEYRGWYGPVQTFWFANDAYAGAFEQVNAGKIVT